MPASDRVRPLRRVRQFREFTSEPVGPDELRAITDVARWSGSSRNSQPWRFIVITGSDAIAWIRRDVRAEAREILQLPAEWLVRTVMAIGHPTGAALRPKSAPGHARRPHDEVVFAERWPEP